MIKLPIYMDYHSTTPVDPRVLEAMLPAFQGSFGNAASRNHPFGWEAERLVERARTQVARILHAEPKEIVFTSGATESNNLALKGVAEVYREKGDHFITQVTEHKSVLDPCKYLEKKGIRVTYLPVDSEGRVNLEDLRKAVTERTLLISVMAANNEIGTIQPLEEIGKIAKERGILFHVDAAQAVGKIPVDVEKMGIDLLSFTSHKMYGPKGVGALYVRRKNPRVRLVPFLHGGGHEGGLRSGTLNVPAIVGFGEACEIAEKERDTESVRLLQLRSRLFDAIKNRFPDVHLNGHPEKRLPGNLNLSFPYVEGESLLMGLSEEVAVSSGSACSSASVEPSYVLKSLGIGEALIHSSIRFGLGRFTTEEEVDYTAKKVAEMVSRLREISPVYQTAKREPDRPVEGRKKS
jgi:cysteine desulfurase